MNNLIWTKQNSLSKEFCKHLIHKFENDDRKSAGRIDRGIDFKVKRSIDLLITAFPGWEDEDKVLYDSLSELIGEYEIYCTQINKYLNFRVGDMDDTGYQIQRTCPGEYYNWHSDSTFESNRKRMITFIWYLNDVHYDGETEFVDGTKIQPETGKALMFPATWTYLHRGVSPKKEVKYICTGWVYAKI